MGMLQNAFANSSFSLLVGKVQGTIVDYLMPPLSTGELMLGMAGASVTRAALVGLAVWAAMLLWPGVHVIRSHLWAVVWFGLMGSLMLSFLGLITSIWAEKFDHAAAVGNFVVTPLSLLSGTFYSITALSPTFQAISHANPFFYVISGFRFGFLGIANSPILVRRFGPARDQLRARRRLLRDAAHRLEAQGLTSSFVHTTCDNYEQILSTRVQADLSGAALDRSLQVSKRSIDMRKLLIAAALVSSAATAAPALAQPGYGHGGPGWVQMRPRVDALLRDINQARPAHPGRDRPPDALAARGFRPSREVEPGPVRDHPPGPQRHFRAASS